MYKRTGLQTKKSKVSYLTLTLLTCYVNVQFLILQAKKTLHIKCKINLVTSPFNEKNQQVTTLDSLYLGIIATQ